MEFTSEAMLVAWLGELGTAYTSYAGGIWAHGFRTLAELSHASDATFGKAGVGVDLHIENIRGSAHGEDAWLAWPGPDGCMALYGSRSLGPHIFGATGNRAS